MTLHLGCSRSNPDGYLSLIAVTPDWLLRDRDEATRALQVQLERATVVIPCINCGHGAPK